MNQATHSRARAVCTSAIVALSLLGTHLAPANAQAFSAGIKVNEDPQVKDTGLNIYPGATIVAGEKKVERDSAAVDLSWGDYGLKVVSIKLRTTDNKESVAKFYRGDMLRFGSVLDCSDPAAVAKDKQEREAESRKGMNISCKSIDAKRNAQVYRVGERNNQRVVTITPDKKGDGTIMHLLHVQVRQPDGDK